MTNLESRETTKEESQLCVDYMKAVDEITRHHHAYRRSSTYIVKCHGDEERVEIDDDDLREELIELRYAFLNNNKIGDQKCLTNMSFPAK